MAKLPWNNVTGQSTNAGTAALGNAGTLFDAALGSFKSIADSKQATLKQQNTAAALDNIRQFGSTADMDSNADSFSTEALTEKYGAGNFDPTLVTSAATTKASNLRDKAKDSVESDRLTQAFDMTKAAEQRAITRENRTIAEAAIQTKRRRKQEEKADKKEEVLNTLSEIPTIEQEVSRNRIAASTALNTFSKAGAIKPGEVIIDSGGNPVFSSTVPEDKQKAFINFAKEQGYSAYTSLSDKVSAFRKASPDAPESVLRAGEQLLTDRYNRTTLSKAASDAIKANEKKLGRAESAELERQARKFDRAIKQVSPDVVETKESRRRNLDKLTEFYNGAFPRSVFLSSVSDDLGGTEGWEEVQILLKDGLALPSGTNVKPPPDVIEEALKLNTYNPKDGFTDTHFDLQKLKKTIVELMSEDAYKERNNLYLEKLETDNATAIDRILEKYSNKSAQAKTKIYKADGRINRGKPAQIIQRLGGM